MGGGTELRPVKRRNNLIVHSGDRMQLAVADLVTSLRSAKHHVGSIRARTQQDKEVLRAFPKLGLPINLQQVGARLGISRDDAAGELDFNAV